MNIPYLIPRIIRHFLPDNIVNFLLKKQLIIAPGIETKAPQEAFKQYIEKLDRHEFDLNHKKVMIFGYGGNLATACLLLGAGAGQVILCERKGFPQSSIDPQLAAQYSNYFKFRNNSIKPKPEYIQVFHQDLHQLAQSYALPPIDLVLSFSVYEHLINPEMITKELAWVIKIDGAQIHFIDLRDHYFKYPFEMLCYSKRTWQTWLNPTSNLNRMRMVDFEKLFRTYFTKVEISIDNRDETAFLANEGRIRDEFKTGDRKKDSVTRISVFAAKPISKKR
ncbi:MAG TPA: hypothetical protein G4N92_03610 [Anaerolineae bacterium]|nr:hypothetical protein [Anaerolineae bacterium]